MVHLRSSSKVAMMSSFIPSRVSALIATLLVVLSCAIVQAQKLPPAKPIDLNVANVKELQELPGVGAVTAQRIIDLRQKSGHFHRVEDLLAVRGISQKKLDAMRPYLTVSAPPPAPPGLKSSPPAKK
jgi:competence ComEA-like helix-hairpin-helix protein